MVSELVGAGLVVPRKMNSLRRAYEVFVSGANYLQAPLLFALRIYFFWQLYQTGQGKLLNIERTAEFFASLRIPLPVLNAYLAGATECFGGLLLVVGLASRLVAIPVAFTMIIAYVAADDEALTSIFSDPDKFVAATPFPFLLSALLVLAFGPGALSIDALIKRFATRQRPGTLSSDTARF
jgi:putative oxidoreductase